MEDADGIWQIRHPVSSRNGGSLASLYADVLPILMDRCAFKGHASR